MRRNRFTQEQTFGVLSNWHSVIRALQLSGEHASRKSGSTRQPACRERSRTLNRRRLYELLGRRLVRKSHRCMTVDFPGPLHFSYLWSRGELVPPVYRAF